MELWRNIPSCVDIEGGTALCYTVRVNAEGLFVYCYERLPIAEWFRPDGSYCGMKSLPTGHP